MVAISPMLVFLEARLSTRSTTLGMHAIFMRRGALVLGDHITIPNFIFLQLPTVHLPIHFGMARPVTIRPMIVLLETSVVRVTAATCVHAILVVPGTLLVGEDLAIPMVLVCTNPLAVLPVHVVGARFVASRPMLILLETRVVLILAASRVLAILPTVHKIFPLGDHRAIPVTLVLLLPHGSFVVPSHVVLTSAVAGRPILVLLETCETRLLTAPSVGAIFVTVRALRFVEHCAVPHVVLMHFPSTVVSVPVVLVGACGVARRPMFILLKAFAFRVLATM